MLEYMKWMRCLPDWSSESSAERDIGANKQLTRLMELYRLTLTKYASSAFSGEGARRVGGRWSPPGYPVVYCASSIALAVLETLVHTDHSVLPSHQVIRVGVPDALRIDTLTVDELPADWRNTPAPSALQKLGWDWIINHQSVLLSMPSALVPQEKNYLINPNHRNFSQLTMQPAEAFSMDARLFQAGRP